MIKDGEVTEYSAHLIPEGGFKKIPKLYGNGVLVVGDAAMLVDNIHWEGTNLAMMSGKLAAETAIYAINNNDFSADCLKLYNEKLNSSFIMKDLKSYKDLMSVMHKRANSFTGYYIKKVNAFFKMFTSVDSVPKRTKFRQFIKSIFTDRCICALIKDGFAVLKLLFGAIK